MTNDRQPGMVENQALTALRFYHENYDQLFLRSVSPGNNALVLGEKPFKCRFCDGEPPARTFKMRAHALPELLGNNLIRTRYECDDCNRRFAAFDDEWLERRCKPEMSVRARPLKPIAERA
jgi:hypothetical protein